MTGESASSSSQDPTATARNKSTISRFLPIVVILAALIGFFALGLPKYFTLETLQENRTALLAWVDERPFLSLGAFMAIYASAVAISFPGSSIMTIFGGFLFGLWKGVPAVVVAATIGALIVFLAAKNATGDAFTKKTDGFIKKMEKGFREDELSYMMLLRLVPLFPFWGINLGAGVLGVSTRNYIIGTFFGIIPGSFVYTGIGATAGTVFDAGEDLSLSGLLLRPESIAILVTFGLLAIAPIIFKKFNKPS